MIQGWVTRKRKRSWSRDRRRCCRGAVVGEECVPDANELYMDGVPCDAYLHWDAASRQTFLSNMLQ